MLEAFSLEWWFSTGESTEQRLEKKTLPSFLPWRYTLPLPPLFLSFAFLWRTHFLIFLVGGLLLASSSYPRAVLKYYNAQDRPLQERIVCLKILTVPRLRNPAVKEKRPKKEQGCCSQIPGLLSQNSGGNTYCVPKKRWGTWVGGEPQ